MKFGKHVRPLGRPSAYPPQRHITLLHLKGVCLLANWSCVAMPLVIPPGFFNVSFQFTQVGSGQKAAFTTGVKGPDPLDPVDANDFEVAVRTPILPLMTADWVHDKVTWSSGAGTVRETFLNAPGTDQTAALIAAAAILVHKRTTLPGRQGRGRWFIPGPGEGAVDGVGNLTAGRLTDWTNAMTAVLFNVNTTTAYDFYLLHNQVLGGPVPPPPTEIISLDVSPKCGIQRRRLR